MTMRIIDGDFGDPQVIALLHLHLSGMRAHSPPDSVHALDASGLTAAGIRLWTIWDGDVLLGFGALKALDDESGEIKSMRTHPDHLRKGVAARLLEHILSEARRRGYKRLSLETGRGPAFEPALALYRRHGFKSGAVFGDYRATDFSQFLHLDL